MKNRQLQLIIRDLEAVKAQIAAAPSLHSTDAGGRLNRVLDQLQALLAVTPAEKRFDVTFSLEGPEFQNRRTVENIMRILGEISGNVATRRISGDIRGADGKVIGNWNTTWRRD